MEHQEPLDKLVLLAKRENQGPLVNLECADFQEPQASSFMFAIGHEHILKFDMGESSIQSFNEILFKIQHLYL